MKNVGIVGQKMKKVGIVSLYYGNYNYGGLLQAYALVKSIVKIGFDAEQICVKMDGRKSIRPFIKVPGKIKKALIKKYYNRKVKERNEKFCDFMKSIPHSKESYTWRTIKETNYLYDVFVCGSDQIWNPNYMRNNNKIPYMLSFVEDERKKVSYAASIGVSKLTDSEAHDLNEAAKSFCALSLREESAKKLFDEELQKRISIVLDPTLLLTSKEWVQQEQPVNTPERYIFCCFLGSSRTNRKKAVEISKELGIPILISPYTNPASGMADIGFGDVRVINAGPKEFLYLIHHAELVITDSFHACVFSMQFKRPFLVLPRDNKDNKSSMHSRLFDFANKFHLQNQLMFEKDKKFDPQCLEVNWELAYEVIEQEREKSYNYLKSALSEINV